jgi:hypothetical protein
VVRLPSASQKQNVNDRLARLQTGGANQNTPKASNGNKLSDKFNKAGSNGSGGSNGGNGNNGGTGGNGKPPGGGNGKLTVKQVDDTSKRLARLSGQQSKTPLKAPSGKVPAGTKLGDKTMQDGKPMVVGNHFNSTASQKYSTTVTTPKSGGTAGGAVSVNRQTRGVALPKDLKTVENATPPKPNDPKLHPPH